ncbi:hypothetical protein VNI00_015147 [Paramarasmius palmivorus]|uniref:Uncharacterized protein n=1 Tax=Paramarasmius palmivorus TaxID=297713 RepID=A0AAW0BM75_9AGAR
MKLQARIPAALAALHNFIMDNDMENYLSDLRADKDATDPSPGAHVDIEDTVELNPYGELATGQVTEEEYQAALQKCNEIAEAMWEQYQKVLQSRTETEIDDYIMLEDILDEGGEEDGGDKVDEVDEDGEID